VQYRFTVCAKRTISSKIDLDAPDGTTRWRGSSESTVCLEIVQILTQDRCMVCAKRTIGSEIILNAPNGTPRWRGSSECSVLSEIVLIMTQDRCTVCVECTIGLKIILDTPDETLSWRRSCGISLLSFGDSVTVDASKVRGLCQRYHRPRNHFGRTRWYSRVTRFKWKLISFSLEIVLILTQYWCTVCVELP
jgi:hypothetical protein